MQSRPRFPRPHIAVACPDLPRIAAPPARAYWLTHAGAPALALLVASIWLIGLHGDFVVADAWFALEGGTWALKHRWFNETLVHIVGRDASLLAWLAVVATWAASFRVEALRPCRRAFAYLALATAAGVGSVSVLKTLANMDCPWDLARYGGLRPFIALWESRPATLRHNNCFPSGHASAGYCWVAIHFFADVARPAWRRRGLAVALLAGGFFGVSQQLRGAHFPSHDLWALAICWYVSLAIHAWMFGAAARRPGGPARGDRDGIR